jgi:hypothetical protein
LKTQRAPGRVASGVLMRLVSLWWELIFPPRLDSNNRISIFGKQQFFVDSKKNLSSLD